MAVVSQPACPDSLPHVVLSVQEGDHRWINSIARALQLLNSLYGPFGKAYGIGRCAKVWSTLLRSASTWGSLSSPVRTTAHRESNPIGCVALCHRRGGTALLLLPRRGSSSTEGASAGAGCGPRWEPGAAPLGPGILCLSQMSYELWRDLEEESEADGQGRKPEIGNVFFMDRGRLERGGQQARARQGGAVWAGSLPGGSGRACAGCREQQEVQGGWLQQSRLGRAVAGKEGGQGRSVRAAWAVALIADTDYVTALCSQVVYEGLVDDTFRIKCGRSLGKVTGRLRAPCLRSKSLGFVPSIVGPRACVLQLSLFPTGTVLVWGAAGVCP